MKNVIREGADTADRESSRTASPAVSHAQHTPGPWRTERVSGQIWIDSDFGGVAKVLGFGHEDDETTPNARLIAAAPDLLAALKALDVILDAVCIQTDHGVELVGPTVREVMSAGADIKAAIAKAEGN